MSVADDGEERRQPATVARRQRAEVLDDRPRARGPRERAQRAGDRLGRRDPGRPGDEDQVAARAGHEDAVHVGVEQGGPGLGLRGVAADVERAAVGGVEGALHPRGDRRPTDDADVVALRARRVVGGDVERGEGEQQREAARDHPRAVARVAAEPRAWRPPGGAASRSGCVRGDAPAWRGHGPRP